VSTAAKHKVVIVGGGFGGLAAARGLDGADVEVTVVDRMNHHLFQPLLYQVASGMLSAGDIASPIRTHLRRQDNADSLMASVTDFDVDNRRVILDRGDHLDYDSLIVACGAETSYFGNDEWRGVSFGLKALEEAVALRDRILGAFEEADRTTDPAKREAWLTFAVIGGGPTGVEIAGQLAILARDALRPEYSHVNTGAARVVLLDAGERVVPAFSEKLSATAARELGGLGVTVREGTRATSIDDDGVTVETGDGEERIQAKTVIWAAGVHACRLTGALARAAGASTDRGGRIEVEPDLTLPGHPEITVIGDAAHLDWKGGKPLPGLATVAIQQGRHVARAIRDRVSRTTGPFHYLDKGALAVVGRGRAICEIRGLGLSGPPAFAIYLGVHLFYLSGIRGRRHRVLDAWRSATFGVRQSRVIEHVLPEAIAEPSGEKPA